MTAPDPSALQEEEYEFPYHYVVRFGPSGFRQSFYDSWGMCYATTIEFMLERIAAAGVGEIVDVGCGDGRFTREMLLRGARRAVGIDLSARAIALARAMNHDLPQLRFLHGDLADLGSEPPFEAAILMEVLEHVPQADAPAFLAGVRNLLQPGGRLFLTVPHANVPVEPKHFRHFTVNGLCETLAPSFEARTVLPFERGGWRRRLLEKTLGNGLFLLSHAGMLAALYRWQKRALFHCDEGECRRIFVEAIAR
jgi:SAM-dependent methyltransferase